MRVAVVETDQPAPEFVGQPVLRLDHHLAAGVEEASEAVADGTAQDVGEAVRVEGVEHREGRLDDPLPLLVDQAPQVAHPDGRRTVGAEGPRPVEPRLDDRTARPVDVAAAPAVGRLHGGEPVRRELPRRGVLRAYGEASRGVDVARPVLGAGGGQAVAEDVGLRQGRRYDGSSARPGVAPAAVLRLEPGEPVVLERLGVAQRGFGQPRTEVVEVAAPALQVGGGGDEPAPAVRVERPDRAQVRRPHQPPVGADEGVPRPGAVRPRAGDDVRRSGGGAGRHGAAPRAGAEAASPAARPGDDQAWPMLDRPSDKASRAGAGARARSAAGSLAR